MRAAGLLLTPPIRAHQGLPTTCPRQEGRTGHHIDVFAHQRVARGRVEILIGSHQMIGTDHEALFSLQKVRSGKPTRRHVTGPRVWTGGVEDIAFVDQSVLEELAQRCTTPRPSQAYQDSDTVKEMFRKAKLLKSKEAWKAALEARRKARRRWESDRLERAAKGDWKSFRECTRRGPVGWEIEYAEAQQKDVHQTVHEHLKKVYSGPPVQPYRDQCPDVSCFTEDELQTALDGLRSGRSVGIDLTSKELLQGLVSVRGGKIHLLEFMNRVLTTREIPRAWNRPLVILLPKVPAPTSATQLRPIVLGSSACKLFSKMLITRVKAALGFRSHAQCAGEGRQTSDLLFSLHRLMELARESKLSIAFLNWT